MEPAELFVLFLVYWTIFVLLAPVAIYRHLKGAPHAESDAYETDRELRERAGGPKSPDDTVF